MPLYWRQHHSIEVIDVGGVATGCVERMSEFSAFTHPMVVLHGFPTSVFEYRNILNYFESWTDYVAADLPGFGASQRLTPPPDHAGPVYTLEFYRRWLDQLIAQHHGGDPVLLFVHGWGSLLGFDWANRHRDQVAGVVHFESIVRPLTTGDLPESWAEVIMAVRSPGGERLVLEDNVVLDKLFRSGVDREFHPEEIDGFWGPFRDPSSRWAMVDSICQLPIDGQPSDIVDAVDDYGQWLASTTFPKLLFSTADGALLRGANLEWCRGWSNQKEIRLDTGPYPLEEAPDDIGMGFERWLRRLKWI